MEAGEGKTGGSFGENLETEGGGGGMGSELKEVGSL